MGKFDANNGWRGVRARVKSGEGATRPVTTMPLLLLALLLPIIWGGGAASAAVQGNDGCQLLLPMESENKIPRAYLSPSDLRHEIQKGLQTIFSGDTRYEAERAGTQFLSDGRIGTVTRKWLSKFCVDYPVFGAAANVPDAVMRSAIHYAEIAAKYPDWKQTISSREFDAWVRADPGRSRIGTAPTYTGRVNSGQINLRQIRRSGAAPVVIRLIDDYVAESGGETRETARSGVDASCDSLLEGGKQNKIPRRYLQSANLGRRIQLGLQAVFAGNPEYESERERTELLTDGRIGRETRKWLARFCANFPVSGPPATVPDSVIRSVLHYEEIDAVRPDWKEVVTASGFNAWIAAAVPGGQPNNRRQRLSGSAPIVIALLEEYPGKVVPVPTPPEDDCAPLPNGGPGVYYQLTQEDWQYLMDREGFVTQVAALVGEKFDTEKELDEAIGPTADLLYDECAERKFLSTMQESARTYRLTAESLKQFRDELTLPTGGQSRGDSRVTQDILLALQDLVDEDFESEEKLAQIVRFKVKLALEGASPTVLDAQSAPQPAPASSRMAAQIEAMVRRVVRFAESKVSAYAVTGQTVQALNGEPQFAAFPEILLERLKSLLGVPYLNARVYETAVRNAMAPKPGDGTEVQPIEGVTGGGVEQYVRAMVTQARKEGEPKAPHDLKAEENCGCAREWDTVGRNRFTVYGFYPFWMSALGDENDTERPEGDQEIADAGIAINFGVLSRIGYYALELDGKGEIPNRGHWTDKKYRTKDFIKTAHKYLSKVDLVIEAAYWRTLDDSTLERAVNSIWSFLDPVESPNSFKPDGVTLYFPDFSRSDVKDQENIVKLVKKLHDKINDQAPEQSSRNLGTVFGGSTPNESPSVNILIDAIGLGHDRHQPHRTDDQVTMDLNFLGGLSGILDQEQSMVDLVLVLVGQPVTDTKKIVRLAVEDEFQGEARTNILRKIVPVIPPNGHRIIGGTASDAVPGSPSDLYRQLQHDLVYFRDNFRGAAFWPAVTTTRNEQDLEDQAVLQQRLVRTFAQSDGTELALQIGETSVPDVCVYVCPNRAYLKAFFFGVLGILLLLAVPAYWNCGFRSLLARYILPILAIVGLLIVLFVAVITCVPTWNEIENEILGALVVILIASWLVYYIRKVKQGPLP